MARHPRGRDDGLRPGRGHLILLWSGTSVLAIALKLINCESSACISQRPVRCPVGVDRAGADGVACSPAWTGSRGAGARLAGDRERDPVRVPDRHRVGVSAARLPALQNGLRLLRQAGGRLHRRVVTRPAAGPSPCRKWTGNHIDGCDHRLAEREDLLQCQRIQSGIWFGGRVRETGLEQSRQRARTRPNTLGWLMQHRRLARDYESLPQRSRTMIRWAMTNILSRRLTGESTQT